MWSTAVTPDYILQYLLTVREIHLFTKQKKWHRVISINILTGKGDSQLFEQNQLFRGGILTRGGGNTRLRTATQTDSRKTSAPHPSTLSIIHARSRRGQHPLTSSCARLYDARVMKRENKTVSWLSGTFSAKKNSHKRKSRASICGDLEVFMPCHGAPTVNVKTTLAPPSPRWVVLEQHSRNARPSLQELWHSRRREHRKRSELPTHVYLVRTRPNKGILLQKTRTKTPQNHKSLGWLRLYCSSSTYLSKTCKKHELNIFRWHLPCLIIYPPPRSRRCADSQGGQHPWHRNGNSTRAERGDYLKQKTHDFAASTGTKTLYIYIRWYLSWKP